MRAIMIGLLAVIAATPCLAQKDVDHDKPELTVAPYLWAPDIAGKVSLGPLSVPIELKVSDLTGGVKAGGMGYAQFGDSRKFLYVEAIVIGFGDKSFAPFFNQAVSANTLFIEGGAGLHRTIGAGSGSIHVSPYAGVRHLAIKARIAGPALSASGRNTAFDPAIGMIVEAPATDRLALIAKLDGAGLGVTANDYLSFAGLAEYRFSQSVSLAAGYRYARGSFPSANGLGMSLRGRGPMIGLRVKP